MSDPRSIREIGHFLPIRDQASISVARNQVRALGADLKLDSTLIEQVAIIASELTQNQLTHAKRGEFLVKPTFRNDFVGLEVIAKDGGPGIKDPRSALRGELSSSSSLGQGLASVTGLSDEVDFDIRLGQGTCVWARKFSKPINDFCWELALLGRPYDGEVVSGDDGGFFRSETGFLACVADGLGHGLLAHRASSQALTIVSEHSALSIPEILTKCDQGLTDTRGAVMSLVRFDRSSQRVECGAVGDVSTHLYYLKEAKHFPAVPHTLGATRQQTWEPRVMTEAVKPGAVLVSFTDGLKTGTTLSQRMDLFRQPAIVVAQTLLEEFGRTNDDVLIFVARFSRH